MVRLVTAKIKEVGDHGSPKAGNMKIKDYLSKDENGTRVTVKGDENADGTMSVTSIEAAPAAK